MFTAARSNSTLGSGFAVLELIYHSTVRSIRKSHGNAIMGLMMNMMQTVVLLAGFYVMYDILGMRRNSIRGDFVIYIMTGIFIFMTHTKALGAVAGAEGPTSAMMKHSPMNTAISIASAALGALYIQVLSISLVLFVYDVTWAPVEIQNWPGVFGMLILAWFTGVAVGTVIVAAKPWSPSVVGVLQAVYSRANMIASGKMFVANALSAKMLHIFDWNPLFHIIDQARGFAFINYNPHYSNILYPFLVGLTILMIGLMGEFYTRQHASLSWGAKR
ncbi:ABC transporter permease [Phaeovulum sp. W22_SRMD_FR3]|uniref:ABC transporter permease n=1 Tax=Phaeovulum sp. W22_SRMD_FR3 TaxID=3240274 RepID=UPI003F992FCA